MSELTYRHWRPGLNSQECVSVDGDAPGRLHLSHWPKNRTPEEFRHDLSTGAALMLARASNRAELLQGITTVTNNHYDTDGVCSAYAVLEPKTALEHAPTLLAAAMAGDFEMFTTPEGMKIDLTLGALTRHRNSAVNSELFTEETERRQAQYEHALKLLPRLLENPDLHADWIAQEFWVIQKDLRGLREEMATVEEHESLDFAIVRCDRIYHRAAVNTATERDRILTCMNYDDGWLYELRLTTRSWFQLASRPYLKRRNWAPLADLLNMMLPGPEGKWVADPITDPTPSVRFADEEGYLIPLSHQPAQVAAVIMSYYRQQPDLPPRARA